MSNHFDILDMSMYTQARQSRGESKTSNVVCFVGEMGIGKTQTVKEWSESRHFELETIILGRIPSVDIGGIPVPNQETRELVHYSTKKLIGGNISEGAKGRVIFFDELASAQEDTQVAVQAIIEDRELDGAKVPDNVFFVTATNLPEHTGGANDLVASLRSRLLFVTFRFDYIEWLRRARTDWKVEMEIFQYHGWSEGKNLNKFDANSASLSQPDPRGWIKIDEAFKAVMHQHGYKSVYELFRENESLAVSIMDGLIGSGSASEFWGFIKCNGSLPSVQDVIGSPESAPVPTQPDAQHAILYNMTHYISRKAEEYKEDKNSEGVTKRTVDSFFTYLRRLPRPMAALGFKILSDATDEFTNKSSKFAEFRIDYSDVVEV